MKKGLIFLLLTCIICACTEEMRYEEDGTRNKNLDIKSENSYHLTEEGALCFTSLDMYFSLTDSLSKLSEEEFSQWEEKLEFISYRTFVNSIIEQIEQEDNKDQVITLLEKYSDFVYVDEDEVIQPIIPSQTYRNIVNKDGIFYIGNIQNKVDNEYLYVIENQTKSSTCKIEYINNKLSTTKAVGDIVEYPTIEYENNDRDRKVFTSFKIMKNAASNGSAVLYKPVLEIFVKAQKRKAFAGFKNYNTICIIEEVTLRMDGIPFSPYVDENGQWKFGENQIKFLAPVESSKEVARFTCTYNLTTSLVALSKPLEDLICIHYRARTRGTGNYGAAYNVYHPKPGMNTQTCGHRPVTEYRHVQ